MNLIERVVPFTAGDGMALNLIHVRSADRAATKGPVLLVHGAGVRANIFRAPTQQNIVEALVAEGYDVWLENWRASIDVPRNPWTLDQAALFDHPQAVRKVLQETGASSLKALIHCQGSTSFMMSLVAGLLPQVSVVVSNAVSLHPVIPAVSKWKITLATPLVGLFTKYLNPYWGIEPEGLFSRLLVSTIKLTHHECDNIVCRGSSFAYGVGFPVMWSHENLGERVHEWLKDEFKNVPIRFFRQMTCCVHKGHLVAAESLPGLPQDFVALPPKTDAAIHFFAGEDNICFLPQSQINTYNYFLTHSSNKHSLTLIPGYGHLDVFMGMNASRDVFPKMLQALASN
ncbi:MAG: esterase [Gammaproteobacteria bacterium]|nr:esterase [Gammaproteobacteria bacterium]